MISRQLSFLAPAAVMSAWAVVMLHTVVTGHINELLSPLFRNYVIIAGVMLAILSVLYLLLYQPTNETSSPLAPTGRLRQFGRWLVLLIPLVAASVLAPSSLSGKTMSNRSSTIGAIAMPSFGQESQAKAKDAIDSDPNQPVPVDVTDLITISQHPDQIKAFDGRSVHAIGLWTKQGDNPKLVRWIMWCCAADALPASVDLTGKTDGAWKDSQWLEVVGKARFPSTLGHVTPQIEVETITPTQEPDEPYLSPGPS
jgi:putative membrane protein